MAIKQRRYFVERAQYLADYAADNCARCDQTDGLCFNNRRIGKCLHSTYIVGTLDNCLYTVNIDYPLTDLRRYNFERPLTRDELAEVLRKNA